MAEWYYARNNQRLGPVSMDQLKQLAASGQLSPGDLVWKDGMANWAPASTVAGLFAASAPAPVAAPRQAPVVAPAPGISPDDVVLPVTSGPSGPSFMDAAMLIATRSWAVDLDTLPVSEPEKTDLSKAGITGETAQRYLAWRRSLLWVALVPLTVSSISLVIDAFYNFESLNGFGVLMEVLRILTLLALPAISALAALTWSKPKTSTGLATLGLLVCYGLPLVLLVLPASWLTTGGEIQGIAIPGLGFRFPMLFALLLSLYSLPPSLVRASLRARTLIPESVVTGPHVVGLSLMSSLFFFGAFHSVPYFKPIFALLFVLCLAGAPLCYVIGAKALLRPIATPGDRSAIALWQWIYFGLCAGAGLILVIQLFTLEGLSAYDYWIAFPLFLDFLGRSLFASVVAAQYIVSSTRTALVTQLQLTKTDQGAALDRRLIELESVCGKM